MADLKSYSPRSDPEVMKNTILAAFVMTMTSLPAFSTILHWPECDSGTLNVKNKTSSDQRVWLQSFNPTLISETAIDVAASRTAVVTVTHQSKSERNSLIHFLNSKDIEATFQCAGKTYPAAAIDGGVQTFKKSDLRQQTAYLKNLFTDKNTFKIETLNRFRQPLKTITAVLNSNEQRQIVMPESVDTAYVRVSAENKFAAFNLNSFGSQNAMIVDPQPLSEDTTAGVYFEVGPRTGPGDSFTVKITNPAMIQKARLQISNPTLEKMLFAKIQKGHQKQNRNLASTTKAFWNWSVTEVTNIADLGSTACNGLPQIVDDRIDSWVQDPGRICFWTYRIKREVPAREIATGQKLL